MVIYRLSMTYLEIACLRIVIISIPYPNFRFDLIDNGDLSICRLSMTSLAEKKYILYNWYILQAFNFRYFHAPHDSTKITPFK